MDDVYTRRGFLPADDPVRSFPPGSELAMLDELGRDLPSLLQDRGFRRYAAGLKLPQWPAGDVWPADVTEEKLPLLRLYYLRLGFLASAYVNQVSEPRATRLPHNIAAPLVRACLLLQRPPILSYDAYALYNWKRFDLAGPVALGNIDTVQNFVHLYDERWFILVHVEIEALGAGVLRGIARGAEALRTGDAAGLNAALTEMAASVEQQVAVLRRIPEKMDPALYFKTFRPYIRFFEHVVYEGIWPAPANYRGETGAQSSLMPALTSFLKVPHQRSVLTDHLADMRQLMPAEHRALLADIEQLPPVRDRADPAAFNAVLEAMAEFREVHYGWALEYIQKWVTDPRGTGGTPYAQWLRQLIDETLDYRVAGG
jgi:indoleamine 2,3-dioxygenase